MKQEPNDEIIKSGVNPDNIRKWKVIEMRFVHHYDVVGIGLISSIIQPAR